MRLTKHSEPSCAPLILIGLLVLMSGCTLLPQRGSEPIIEPQLPPKPAPLPAPVEPREPPPVAAPTPEPDPDPGAEPVRIAILLGARTPAYESVANALAAELVEVDIYDLADRSLTPKEKVDLIRSTGTEVVVAIGIRAAEFARSIEGIPVILSQVFNLGHIDLDSDQVKGVAVLPPLDLQIAAWQAINPNLRSIGAILGTGHDRLIEEAASVAEASGVRFQHRVALSDRETLYLFTRLVPDIDGFWLFPDNRILSTTVLRQMLTYATRHQVQVAVFNDSLLPLGATISTTSVDEDVAETIITVANQLLSGAHSDVPAVTPLNKIQVRTRAGGPEQLASDSLDVPEGVH